MPASGQSAPLAVPASIEKAIVRIQVFLSKSIHQLAIDSDDATSRTIIKVIDHAGCRSLHGTVIAVFHTSDNRPD